MLKTTPRVRPGRVALVAAAAALALTTTACAGTPPSPDGDVDDVLTVRIAMTNSIPALGVWVAQEQGYLEDHGIELDIEEISTTVAAQVPSLLGRQYDIAQMTPTDLLQSAEGGIDVVSVSAGYVSKPEDDGVLIVAGEDSGIASAEDLVGKRIAAPSINGNVNIASMYWLISEGIDPDDVEVVAAGVPNMPDLLAADQIDAAEGVIPYGGLMASRGVRVANPIESLGDRVQMSFWSSARGWAEDNSESVSRFRAALDDASAWMLANSDETVDLLMEKTGVPAEYKEFLKVPEFVTVITADDMEIWYQAMNKVTGFTTDISMSSLVFDPQ